MTSHLESGSYRRAEGTAGIRPLSKLGTEKQVPGSSRSAHEKKAQATNYMALVSRGDRQAFGKLHEHHVSRVAAFFRRYFQCRETIEDLTQEVFGRVWEKRDRYHSGTADHAWMLGFARNILREYRSKLRPNQRIDVDHALDCIIDSAQASPHERVATEEQARILRGLVADLPEKQRQAVDLVYLKGLSIVETSLQTGSAVKTLRNYCSLSLLKLRTGLRVKHCNSEAD